MSQKTFLPRPSISEKDNNNLRVIVARSWVLAQRGNELRAASERQEPTTIANDGAAKRLLKLCSSWSGSAHVMLIDDLAQGTRVNLTMRLKFQRAAV